MTRRRRPSPEPDRDNRIAMEIVVDCYDETEVAMGWYCYLQDALSFPFAAVCKIKRAISPLTVGHEVDVVDIGPEEECAREIFVSIKWNDSKLAVPLAQLKVCGDTDDQSTEAVEDWLYWVEQGREF